MRRHLRRQSGHPARPRVEKTAEARVRAASVARPIDGDGTLDGDASARSAPIR